MKEKLVCLFDMDGTLTEPRLKIKDNMIEALIKLSKQYEVGIVSGSGMEYIEEQCHDLLKTEIDLKIYPCNGTEKYIKKGNNIKKVESNSMIQEIGEENYYELIEFITRKQLWLIKNFKSRFNMTGTFFQFRGSMLNWCMCGRDSGKKERDIFSSFDKEFGIRKVLVEIMKNSKTSFSNQLSFAIGGSTSIDIYPIGWDKTFCLKNYTDEQIYFFGDATNRGQNDFEIYEKLKPNSFSVNSPEETISIINKMLDQ